MPKIKNRVLIVEDNSNIRSNYVKRLSQLDIVIDQAANKQEALEKINCTTYHLALIDVMLTDNPTDRGGLEIAKKLQEMKEGTAAIIISATNDIRVPVEAYQNQIVDYLIKKDIKSTKIIVEKVSNYLNSIHLVKYGNFDSLIPYCASPESLPYWHDYISISLDATPPKFSNFLEDLLEPFLPILRKKQDKFKFHIDSKLKCAYAELWSKAIGKKIFVFLSSSKSNSKSPIDDASNTPLLSIKQNNLIGKIYAMTPSTRSDFIESMYDEKASLKMKNGWGDSHS